VPARGCAIKIFLTGKIVTIGKMEAEYARILRNPVLESFHRQVVHLFAGVHARFVDRNTGLFIGAGQQDSNALENSHRALDVVLSREGLRFAVECIDIVGIDRERAIEDWSG